MCRKHLHQWLIVLVCLAILVGSADACSQAVFDYALAKWPAEPYVLTLFHSGKLLPQEQALVDEVALATDSGANLEVMLMDVDSTMPTDAAKLWKQCQGKTLPYIVLDAPSESPLPGHIWAGELKDFQAGPAMKSPVRSRIVDHIAAGGSAVWVVLESGNKAKDTAAQELLSHQLTNLEGELKLPSDLDDSQSQPATVPAQGLRAKFPIIHLSRTDPNEQMLVRMFLSAGVQDDASEPMAYVVFGRGRFLGPLVGKEIDDDSISELCTLLTGECSCQVQESSPGVQLLITADWGAVIELRQADTPPIAPATVHGLPSLTSRDAQASAQIADASDPAPSGKMVRNFVILALCGGAILAAATAWMSARRAKRAKPK